MNTIKSWLRNHYKKWYFWVVLFLLLTLIIPSNKPQENTVVIQPIQQVASTTTPQRETTQPIEKKVVAQQVVTTPREQSGYTYYSITEVVDGDTVKVNINGTIETLRLIGLDTPETVDPRKPVQCFGKEASNKGKELLTGKRVRLEKDSTQGDKDKYGRTLAYIHTESGIFYNKYMIEQGYAHEYTYNTPYKYQTEFKEAQRVAQQNQLGLWSPNTCNGVTTSSTQTSTTNTGTGKFYTSSYSTSKYFYPETCDGWKSLNSKYLKVFSSLPELLAQYPSRVKSPECQ